MPDDAYRRMIRPRLGPAIDALQAGGVIVYPTEGVFGLGCRPDNINAIRRILVLKGRPRAAGLILVAAGPELLAGWIADGTELPAAGPVPTTWIVSPGPVAHGWITGRHAGIAVRITTHPVAAALSAAIGMPLVSTSANRRGRIPARTPLEARRRFLHTVDAVTPGQCGPADGPSEIRDLSSGRILRAGRPAQQGQAASQAVTVVSSRLM